MVSQTFIYIVDTHETKAKYKNVLVDISVRVLCDRHTKHISLFTITFLNMQSTYTVSYVNDAQIQSIEAVSGSATQSINAVSVSVF